jgi:hypothetical protein
VKQQADAISARSAVGKIDEIHNLNLATAAGEDMSDHLKYFTARYLELRK